MKTWDIVNPLREYGWWINSYATVESDDQRRPSALNVYKVYDRTEASNLFVKMTNPRYSVFYISFQSRPTSGVP